MQTIGIIGGLGPESTIAYYRYITTRFRERFGHYAYPEILIHSLSFQAVVAAEYDVPDMIREAVLRLESAGADFVIAACNSIHRVYDAVSPGLPIPWISIVDPTLAEIRAQGLACVALLGTKFTMQLGFYDRILARNGVKAMMPSPAEQEDLNRIIYDELVYNIVREDSRHATLALINALRARGAAGVILACTELPFLITQAHTDLPVFDTATLHAEYALRLAVDGV